MHSTLCIQSEIDQPSPERLKEAFVIHSHDSTQSKNVHPLTFKLGIFRQILIPTMRKTSSKFDFYSSRK